MQRKHVRKRGDPSFAFIRESHNVYAGVHSTENEHSKLDNIVTINGDRKTPAVRPSKRNVFSMWFPPYTQRSSCAAFERFR